MGKSRNTRFVNRVFTPDEQRQIFNSPHPDTVLWALWAGKETAYKIVRKFHPEAPAVPQFYEVKLVPEDEYKHPDITYPAYRVRLPGIVHEPCGKIHIRSFVTDNYVHCIGTADSIEALDTLIWQVNRINPASRISRDYESMCVRDALKRHLSAYIDQCPEEIDIRREKDSRGMGPPFVYINGRKAALDISLSHDGRFTAHAFVINGITFEMTVNPEARLLKTDSQSD
jgi:hypothetical protein